MKKFTVNCKVVHQQLGLGFFVSDLGDSAVIRFSERVEICPKTALEPIPSIDDLLLDGTFPPPQKTISHFQALAIRSVNDKWGVFGRSKIDLLPHQLWVCRQTKSMHPCRLLIADDVGLGKTIEAGIILSSFFSEGKIRRLLVLTPASLVQQWQARMRDMFDIRLTEYSSSVDTQKSRFWDTSNFVVASFHTLRTDRDGRMDRFLQVEPWDLVIVDEAHHLNKEKKQGATLGHTLLQRMNERNLVRDMIFFTGTPHRGKDYGFFSLMRLLSAEFDPEKNRANQLELLHKYMIRNNKYNVTDLHGKKLFQKPLVIPTTYSYTNEERRFYELMTTFISNGQAYASTLNQRTGNAVMLVLIAMQKLASSSVAAIKHALANRLKKLESGQVKTTNISFLRFEEDDFEEDSDLLSQKEIDLIEQSNFLLLMNNEKEALSQLLKSAEDILEETKIESILNTLHTNYSDESILFFTEYKATQRLLLEALMKRYGANSTTIINGDERLDDVHYPDGSCRRLIVSRADAAEQFNSGERRFLIATEAAGEGIDLQANCHIMFHVDLPWNPMRLHQRVGRLNRYGQTQQVIVHNFRNPDTVESRIWEKLNSKIAEIDRVFGAVMEEKEDLFQLVLGMTPPKMFRDLFAFAPQNCSEENLAKWYNAKTATFGGEDVFKVVKSLVGNAAKFNYDQISKHLPQTDLQDLIPFFRNMFAINHKRLTQNGRAFSFQTPESWESFGIRDKYENQIFARNPQKGENVMGVGFCIFDKALEQALKFDAPICAGTDLDVPLLIWSVHDQFTDHHGEKQSSYYGVLLDDRGKILEVLPDWKLLKKLNAIKVAETLKTFPKNIPLISTIQMDVENAILQLLREEDFRPNKPVFVCEGAILP